MALRRTTTKLGTTGRLMAGSLAAALMLVSCGGDTDDPVDDTPEPDAEPEEEEEEEEEEEDTDADEPETDDPAAADATEVLGTDRLRWIVPFGPGGGTDTTSRQIQGILSDRLGMPIEIENVEGGSQSIGTTVALNEGGAECQTVFIQAIPHISLSWMLQETEYTYDDIAALGNIVADAGLIRVANDAPWETAQDLIDDAIARPGEISMSTSGFSSANYLALVQIMEETGAEFNIVNYDGGNAARTAVLSGEVDGTHATVYNSLHVADDTRVLAVHTDENRWPDLTGDAPTLNEALGTDLPPAPSNVAVFTSAQCKQDHPERFELLTTSLESAVTSDEFHDALAEVDEQDKIGWIGPDELDAFITDQAEGLRPVIEQIDELELVQ